MKSVFQIKCGNIWVTVPYIVYHYYVISEKRILINKNTTFI